MFVCVCVCLCLWTFSDARQARTRRSILLKFGTQTKMAAIRGVFCHTQNSNQIRALAQEVKRLQLDMFILYFDKF